MSSPATSRPAAIVLVDGEHYPTAVADAIASLAADDGWDICGAVLVGGSEKLRTEPDYGVPHVTGSSVLEAVRAGLDRWPDASALVDLADEPVLVFEQRLAVIALAAGRGLAWVGADARVDAPAYETIDSPTLAITGTGKRIGKTAISAHLARLADVALGGDGAVVVVAMGRGGPAEPVVIDRAGGPITVEHLLAISRGGSHAASDYLEDAALTGLTTVGCRRVGGGLLGVPVRSNVPAGARLAAERARRLVVLEGSGSCIPPVMADRTMLIASTARPRDLFDDLGPYRLDRADLLLVMGDDADLGGEMVRRAREWRPDLESAAVRLVPTPVGNVAGARVAAFTTAPAHVIPVVEDSLRRAGAVPALVSCALASRDQLRLDLDRAVAAGVDVICVEIKAAGIDVVAEVAATHGLPVVFLDNPPVAHDPSLDLDALLVRLAADAAAAT